MSAVSHFHVVISFLLSTSIWYLQYYKWFNVSGVGTRSLVVCVCFGDRCLSFCTFPFGYCVICFSSIFGFGLPLWYLQTLHTNLLIYSQYLTRVGYRTCNLNGGTHLLHTIYVNPTTAQSSPRRHLL